MRKINLAAVQAGNIWFDERFDCLSPEFDASAKQIAEGHVLPRIDHHINIMKGCVCDDLTLVLTNEDVGSLSDFLLADKPFFNDLATLASQMTEEKFSDLASQKQMYIAACYVKPINGINYNVVTIFKPNGQIAGLYKKTHVPPNEMWHVDDGGELNVIELDFGLVGVMICYDMMFPEPASVLALSGAEIILHPTAGYGWYDEIGEATLRTRANDNAVFILTAKNYVNDQSAGKSSVIDRWGRVLADAGYARDIIVSKTVDLDEQKLQEEWHYPTPMSGIADVRKRYLQERRPELYSKLTEPVKRLRIPDDNERATLREMVRQGKCRWS